MLLLDEPTTALDVTVEAGIVDLIREISAEFGTSMLYISHNLGLVRETCDRITVMYCGEAVEVGAVASVFRGMRHPYTQGLLRLDAGAERGQVSAARWRADPGPARRRRASGRRAACFGPRCAYFAAGRCDARPRSRCEPSAPLTDIRRVVCE